MTGTYRFQTEFHGLTYMPAQFQRPWIISYKDEKTYCILDDVLIISKGSEDVHKNYVLNCLKRLHENTSK